MSRVFTSLLLFLFTATGCLTCNGVSDSQSRPLLFQAHKEKKELRLLAEDGAWLVRLDRGGGFGGATTSLTISSTGEALLVAGITYRCFNTVNSVERSGLAKFIASVEKIGWDQVKSDERGQSDLIRFELTLLRRKGDSQHQYNATIFQNRKAKVPRALWSLVEKLGRLQKTILERCR